MRRHWWKLAILIVGFALCFVAHDALSQSVIDHYQGGLGLLAAGAYLLGLGACLVLPSRRAKEDLAAEWWGKERHGPKQTCLSIGVERDKLRAALLATRDATTAEELAVAGKLTDDALTFGEPYVVEKA